MIREICTSLMPQWTDTKHKITFFCLWPALMNSEGFFQGTKTSTCINISDMSLNSQSLPKYLYPDTVLAEQEFCSIPCSYMCSPWTLSNKYTSNWEERVWNTGVIISSSSKDVFALSTSSGGDVSPVDGSVFSHCPHGKVFPKFLFLMVKGRTAAKQDPFMTLAS